MTTRIRPEPDRGRTKDGGAGDLIADAPVFPSTREPGAFTPVPVAGLVGTGPVGAEVHRARGDGDILGGTEVPASTQAVLSSRRGRGSPLPQGFARRMEEGFGVSLGDVRVHTDGESGELARRMQSTAFTLGSDIYFSRGSYAPSTARGQHLLAHELAHVAQQPDSASSGGGGSAVTVGHAADPAEAQADRMADTVLRTLQARDGAALRRRSLRRWAESSSVEPA